MAEERKESQEEQKSNGPVKAIKQAAEAIEQEVKGEIADEEHQMGPFKHPESVMVAGIEERVGVVPKWLVYIFVGILLVAAVAWVRIYGY